MLGGAAASAGLALIPFARRPDRLFVPASLDPRFGGQLQRALAGSLAKPIELVRVASLLEVPALLDASGSTVYTFAGPALEAALARALEGRRLVRLSFGTRLEPELAAGPVRHVHLGLAGAFEHAGAWAARHLGSRAVIRATGPESTSDLAFAFRHGFEAHGGELVQTLISEGPELLPAAPAEVTLVLASGPAAPKLWAALARSGGAGHLLTHPFATGAPEGTRIISTWSQGSALDALAARTSSPSPLEARLSRAGSFESIPLSTSAAGTAHLEIEDWALKSGGSTPYTGC